MLVHPYIHPASNPWGPIHPFICLRSHSSIYLPRHTFASIRPAIYPTSHPSLYRYGCPSRHFPAVQLATIPTAATHPTRLPSSTPFLWPSGQPSRHMSSHPLVQPSIYHSGCPSSHPSASSSFQLSSHHPCSDQSSSLPSIRQTFCPAIQHSIHRAIEPSV